MALDINFLKNLEKPILHFYDWDSPSATYGYFVDLKKHIDMDKALCHNLNFARRPTGGGIVFHIWDLAFSFLMPSDHPLCSENTLENYQFVNQIVLDSVVEYLDLKGISLIPENGLELHSSCSNFCMARPTIYDVVYNGMKIAGAAQRRTKKGYLHQGTISLAFPHLGLLKDVLIAHEELIPAMTAYTFAPLGTHWDSERLKKARAELQEILHRKFLIRLE